MSSLRASDPKDRIQALDALRGFALCGIIVINIYQTLHMRNLPGALALFVEGRFFVIFSLLFGIGFGMFLDSAARRVDRPRVLLVRRLVVLGVLGALHMLLQPGEVLRFYAVFGLVILLPFSYLSRRVNAIIGVALLGTGIAVIGGPALIPGLFVIGLALSAYRVPQTLPERTPLLGWLTVAFILLSLLVFLMSQSLDAFDTEAVDNLLSVLMSFAYMTGFLLVLRTPLRLPLVAALAPLGRMALTNYLTATVLFVPLGLALGLEDSARWGRAIALGAGILAVQAVVSAVWLRKFRYGPLEWAWRCATWNQRVPLRTTAAVTADRG
jgi:uncharacterized protein